MLQSIRDHTHGWIAGIIISMLILSFSLWGIHSYFESAGANNTVAKVNGVSITRNQLASAYERMRRQLQIQYSANYQLPERAELSLKETALQTLINVQILKDASLSEDFRISPQQIDGYLQSIPEFQVNGEFSLARFQQMLATTLFSAGDFLELIKTSLLIDQPRLGLIFTSFALPNEIENTMALVGQERDISYVIIPQNFFANQAFTIPQGDIEAYYNKHQDEFRTPEQASIQYVELNVKDLANLSRPTEAALKTFYNENASLFTQPAEWKLDEIVLPLTANASDVEVQQAQDKINGMAKQLENGAGFSAFSNQYPGKDVKQYRAGILINQLPTELQKSVVTLTKIGQVSAPVRTKEGFVLIKVLAYKEAKLIPYEAAKDKVKETYSRQQGEEKFGDIKDKLANLTYEHPDSLDAAAKELGLQVQTTELFTKAKGANDISQNAKIREAAFSNEVLNLQNNSDVIPLSSDSVIVLRVKSHIPATLLSLNAVQNQIIEKLRADMAAVKLSQLSNEIVQKLQKGVMTPRQVKDTYKLTWVDAGMVGRHAPTIDSGILDAAFDMPKPRGYAAAKMQKGYAIIALHNVKEGKINDTKSQYQAYAEQIQSAQGLLEYALYKESLVKRAKVVKETD